MQKKNSIVVSAICISGLYYITPVYSMGWFDKICDEICRIGDQISAETTRACHRTGDELNRIGDQISAETTTACHTVGKAIGYTLQGINTAGNALVNEVPIVKEIIRGAGGVHIGVGTNGSSINTYVGVSPNNVPAKVIDVIFSPEGTHIETPLQNLFKTQPPFKQEEIEGMMNIINPGRFDQDDLAAVNKELQYDLTNLSKQYGVYVLDKHAYYQPVNFYPAPVFYIAIGGAAALNPVTIAVTGVAFGSLVAFNYCLTHGTYCREYAENSINAIEQYANQYPYFAEMKNKIQDYLVKNQTDGNIANYIPNNVTVEFSSEPFSVTEKETTHVYEQPTAKTPGLRIKHIPKRTNAVNNDIAKVDKPVSDIFSFDKYDLTEETAEDGKVKLIVHVPVAKPQEYNENYNQNPFPHSSQPKIVNPIYNPQAPEMINSGRIHSHAERAIDNNDYSGLVDDEFEYRKPNEIELQFLARLGYSEADWDAAMTQKTPCNPFLKGGPYVLVRALASHCAKGSDHPLRSPHSIEVHHMPSIYAITEAGMKYIGKNTGPSLAMRKADHARTESNGRSSDSIEHRNEQLELIQNGHFFEALEKDIQDVQEKFPGRYNVGIYQLHIYYTILESTGYVQ